MDPKKLKALITERDELDTARSELLEDAHDLEAAAADDERDLTEDEQARFDDLLEQAKEKREAGEAVQKKIDRASTLASEQAALMRGRTLRAGKPDSDPDDARGGEGLGLVRYAEKFTGRADSIIVRKFQAGDRALAERVVNFHRALALGNMAEARALAEGTGSTGGFLVPEEFAADVVEKLGQETPLANREFMRVYPMGTDTLHVPTLATRPDVQRIAENTAGTGGTDPAFGEVILTANRFGRVLPMSEDFLMDVSIAMVEFLRDLYAEILAEKRNDLILNGTGTNEPEGVRVAAGVATDASDQTDGGTIHDSVIDAYNVLTPKNRAGGIWITAPQGWAKLAKVKATDDQPIIQRLTDEPFVRLLGHPLFVTEAVPENLGGGSNETEIIFGNFRRGYAFGDRMQLEVSTDSSGKYFENFQTAIRVSERYDGKVANADMFVRSTGWTP